MISLFIRTWPNGEWGIGDDRGDRPCSGVSGKVEELVGSGKGINGGLKMIGRRRWVWFVALKMETRRG